MARPMKDGLGPAAVDRLVTALGQVHPELDENALRRQVLSGLETLELKERVHHVIGVLHDHLPSFENAAPILQRVPEVWDPGDPDDNLRGFAAWPLIDYVGVYGTDHFDLGLETLRVMTGMFTAEFAIRPFLLRDLDRTLATLGPWSLDSDEAVRRLVSEGTRPLLPWAVQIPALRDNPDRCLPLLETVRDDLSETVRRSVANHLNDHAKAHPDWVLDVCERWDGNADAPRKKLIRHALRTILKSTNPRVFPLLGYTANLQVDVRDASVTTPHVVLGEALEFSVTLVSTATCSQRMVVDFALRLRKKNGEQRAKVFKWGTPQIAPGKSIKLQKRHPIRAVTTRTYYSGEQGVDVLVNGRPYAEMSFGLEVPESS